MERQDGELRGLSICTATPAPGTAAGMPALGPGGQSADPGGLQAQPGVVPGKGVRRWGHSTTAKAPSRWLEPGCCRVAADVGRAWARHGSYAWKGREEGTTHTDTEIMFRNSGTSESL